MLYYICEAVWILIYVKEENKMTNRILFSEIEKIKNGETINGKYLIILNNGDYFTLSKKSTFIPDFSIDSIVYAHKHIGYSGDSDKYYTSDYGYIKDEYFDYEEYTIEKYSGKNMINTIVKTNDEKRKICIDKIKCTVEYLTSDVEYTIKNDPDYREYEFFNNGACACYVRIKDRFIVLNSETDKTDAEFVKSNIDKIDYFYVVNEDFDTVIGDIEAFQNECGNEYLTIKYYKGVEQFKGKFTVDEIIEYLDKV
jgi:hypothetical protein